MSNGRGSVRVHLCESKTPFFSVWKAALAGRPHRCHWVLITAKTLLGSRGDLTEDTRIAAGYASGFEGLFLILFFSWPPSSLSPGVAGMPH